MHLLRKEYKCNFFASLCYRLSELLHGWLDMYALPQASEYLDIVLQRLVHCLGLSHDVTVAGRQLTFVWKRHITHD